MNLPNKLTITRLVLTIIIIILLLFPFYTIGIKFPIYNVGTGAIDSKYLLAGIIFVIAAVTDFFDGAIARKYNLITDTGKMLDAIADKVLVNSVLIMLAAANMIPTIIPVIIVIRDIVVNAIKMEASAKGKVIAAINSGKAKTACMLIGVTLTLFYNLPFELWSIRINDLLLYAATILSIISMIEYFSLNKELLFSKKK